MSLRVQNLSVTRAGQPIVSAASFTAPEGKITGLIGPNGAGKSTLLDALLGLTPIASGTASFSSTDLLALSRRDRARLAAFVEQSATTEERLTVADVVALGRIPHQSMFATTPPAEDTGIIAKALQQLGLTPFSHRLFHTLSGGEQQRAHIARALAQQPRLLVLDEPTSHLDIRAQLLVLDLLQQQSRDGLTTLIALHDLNLTARYCDHLVVLHAGRVAAEGPPAEVLTPAMLLAIYGVHATILTDPASARPVIVYSSPATLQKPD